MALEVLGAYTSSRAGLLVISTGLGAFVTVLKLVFSVRGWQVVRACPTGTSVIVTSNFGLSPLAAALSAFS